MCLSDAVQLASIPGLEDVTVSTPAPSQPGSTAVASAGGTSPPSSSGAPQSAAEVYKLHSLYLCLGVLQF